MNRAEIMAKNAVETLDKLGVKQHDWSNLMFEVGCEFLEHWYGQEKALTIQTETNFWDLFYLEWIKDDKFLLSSRTYESYEEEKRNLITDSTLLRIIHHEIR